MLQGPDVNIGILNITARQAGKKRGSRIALTRSKFRLYPIPDFDKVRILATIIHYCCYIDKIQGRKLVEERFSMRNMISDIEGLYQCLATSKRGG